MYGVKSIAMSWVKNHINYRLVISHYQINHFSQVIRREGEKTALHDSNHVGTQDCMQQHDVLSWKYKALILTPIGTIGFSSSETNVENVEKLITN